MALGFGTSTEEMQAALVRKVNAALDHRVTEIYNEKAAELSRLERDIAAAREELSQLWAGLKELSAFTDGVRAAHAMLSRDATD